MLFEEGNEFKNTKGLSLIEGKVDKLIIEKDSSDINVLPHVGWNKIFSSINNKIDPLNQYFVHSYVANNVPEKYVTYRCEYSGNKFIAAVNKDLISGFQFHPERSGIAGLNLLKEEIIKLVDQSS